MTTDLNNVAANSQPEFKFHAAHGIEISQVGGGSKNPVVYERAIDLIGQIHESGKAMNQSLLKAAGGAAVGAAAGGGFGALLGGLGALAYEVLSGTEQPNHGLQQQGENKGKKIGYSFFSK